MLEDIMRDDKGEVVRSSFSGGKVEGINTEDLMRDDKGEVVLPSFSRDKILQNSIPSDDKPEQAARFGGITKAKIEVNYDELANIQKLFNNESQGINQLYQETKRKVDALTGQGQGAGWIGRGSEAFFAEMQNIVLPSMQRLAQALLAASSATGRISQTFRSGEEEAKSLFKVQ
jgi:WXG100 family type VII secretion target